MTFFILQENAFVSNELKKIKIPIWKKLSTEFPFSKKVKMSVKLHKMLAGIYCSPWGCLIVHENQKTRICWASISIYFKSTTDFKRILPKDNDFTKETVKVVFYITQ